MESEIIEKVKVAVNWRLLSNKLFDLVLAISSRSEEISVDQKMICKYALDLWMHCQIYMSEDESF